jgi:hypothetical protein
MPLDSVAASALAPSLAAASINLKYARYEVWPDKRLVRTTLLYNGMFCDGARDEHAWQNIREAESQGYKGKDCVWRSLVEHEFLHSLVAEVLFDRPSLVMTTEAGGEFTPLWQRYEEEAICLACQVYLNNEHDCPSILLNYDLYLLSGVVERVKNLRDNYVF